MSTVRGYFCIEARFDTGRGTPEFVEVDKIGGTLDDAKSVAQSYLDRHASSHDRRIEWVEGEFDESTCYYGRSPNITFRVTS